MDHQRRETTAEATRVLSPVKQALLNQRLKRATSTSTKVPEIPRRAESRFAPLSFTQHQIWLIEQMTPGTPAYHLPYAYRIHGRLHAGALEHGFNRIVERHESLRTTFKLEGGEPRQCIHPALTIRLEQLALDQPDGPDADQRLEALVAGLARRTFDLSCLPLIRAFLIRLREEEHLLLINLHHIVADGLSIGVLMNELDAFYRAATGEEVPPPPELALQVGDFAAWQRQQSADGTRHAGQLDFWRSQLSDTLPTLELPADRPRPARQSFRGANVFFHLSAGQVAELNSVACREGCTFFMLMLTAYLVLLHRYTEAEDLMIGTPLAARTPAVLEPLIGLILNMTALRCDVSGDPTFVELLRRSRKVALNAFSNGDVPFELVVERLKFERDPGRNPVFQTVLQVLPDPEVKLGRLKITPYRFDPQIAQFDLALHLYGEAGGYHGRFEFCSDLFDVATVQRMSRHFQNLLGAIVGDPDQPVSRLNLLDDEERHRLLVEWNRTDVDYPRDACIHELFEAWARRTPDACALELGDRRLTYRELDERANQLARFLLEQGVRRETPVAIGLERGLEAIVAILATLKAGAAYVPLDPELPEARLRFMLQDSAAPVLLTRRALVQRLNLEAAGLQSVCLDSDWPHIASLPATAPGIEADARNLAYIIYTSGSTGQPKGVCIEHRGVVRLVKSTDYVSLGPSETLLQFAPLSFDASTFEIWGSLLNGARLVICPPGAHSTSELGQLIRDRKITTLWLTAALFHQMVDDELDCLRSVRQLIAGGDVLSPVHVRRLLENPGGNRLINGYGPTENTTFTCCHVMTADSRVGPSVPIGRPINNTRVYVLDRHRQPVPIGVPGELYAGGDGVARAYLNQPELTARAFALDPFGLEPAGRMYRTGDRVRFRSDGTLEFLGRIDQQIKLRGFRIEPAEIEACLLRHPGVREAIVLAREDVPGDRRLVAYVVPANKSSGLLAELCSLMDASLPSYMVPSAVVALESMPLTRNGKLDRARLPAPSSMPRAISPPRTATAKRLASIWTAVLGIEPIGSEDNFFALGGNSMLAMRVVSRIRVAWGIDLPLRQVFEHQTLSKLADALEDQLEEPAPSAGNTTSDRHPFIPLDQVHP